MFRQQLLREIQLVVFHQRFPGRMALRLQKRISHRAADQHLIDHLRQVLDHLDLVRDLGAAENRHARPLGIRRRHSEILQFLIHQQPGRALAHEPDHSDCRGMRAMRRTERVVHIDVAELRQFLRKRRIVRFLFLMKAQIFQQQHLARRGQHGLHFGAHAIGRQLHRLAQQFLQFRRHRLHAHLGVRLAFGTPQMRRQNHSRALFQGILNGRQRGAEFACRW